MHIFFSMELNVSENLKISTPPLEEYFCEISQCSCKKQHPKGETVWMYRDIRDIRLLFGKTVLSLRAGTLRNIIISLTSIGNVSQEVKCKTFLVFLEREQ